MDAIADDLLYFHWQLMQRIEPDHLVTAKWDTTPAPLKRWIDFFNKFSDYIVLKIQSEAKGERKARVAEFFLILAECCERRRDFVTPLIVLSALNRSETCNLANKVLDEPCEAIFNRLSDLFQHYSNFPKLREKLRSAAGTFHIPYHGILNKDLTTLKEIKGEENINGEISLNESKLLQIQRLITGFLSVKSMPFPIPGREPDHFYADLPFQVENMVSIGDVI